MNSNSIAVYETSIDKFEIDVFLFFKNYIKLLLVTVPLYCTTTVDLTRGMTSDLQKPTPGLYGLCFILIGRFCVCMFVEALRIVSGVAEHANQNMKYLVSGWCIQPPFCLYTPVYMYLFYVLVG